MLCLMFQKTAIITVHNEVGKVMFSHVCVCPQGGSTWVPGQVATQGPGTSPQGPGTPRTRYTPGTRYTPQDQIHPQTRYTPRPGTPPDQVQPPDQVPLGTRYTPRTRYIPRPDAPPRRWLLLRAVRILLQCILVTENN